MTKLVLTLAACVTALFAQPARADDGGGEQNVVMIVKVGEEDEAGPLIRATSSQLSDLDLELRLHPEPELPQGIVARVAVAARVLRIHGAVAVFWRDPGPGGRVRVFYFRSDVARIISREVELPEAGEPSEAVAIIVRQTVAEILAGEEIGEEAPLPPQEPADTDEEPVENEATPAEIQPEEPATGEPSFHRVQATVGYAIQLQATEGMLIQGFHLELGVRVHPSIEIFAGYRPLWPTRIEDASATLEIRRHPAHLGLRGMFALGRFRLGGATSFVVDYQTIDTELTPGLDPVKDGGEVELAVTADLEAGLEILDWLWLRLALGAEIPITRQYYYLPTSPTGGRRVLFDPWPVQPRAVLGLRGEFL